MANEVISVLGMCGREGTSLQRGMNFGLERSFRGTHVRKARCALSGSLEDDGTTLIYEGHDEPKSAASLTESGDQPYRTAFGTLTQNGRFFEAAQGYKDGHPTTGTGAGVRETAQGHMVVQWRLPPRDSWQESDASRTVSSSNSSRSRGRKT
jgi:hypothetical protein